MSTIASQLVLIELRKTRRPISVRRMADRLSKPNVGAPRYTEDQVRYVLEKLVRDGNATRHQGRWRRSVRYRATATR